LIDHQNRAGNKGAGIAGASEANVDRRERLRKLALETIDVNKVCITASLRCLRYAHIFFPLQDPYILRNHLGSLECRLCLTLHTNEGSYLAHTQGKKHQTNLARRAARDAKQLTSYADSQRLLTAAPGTDKPKKQFIKIGRPGYKITKVREPYLPATDTDKERGGRLGLLFQIHLPEIKQDVQPMYRLMSSFEQHVEPQDRAWQYLVVAAEPYETISFKLRSHEIDRSEGVLLSAVPGSKMKQEPGTWAHWDPDVKTYSECMRVSV
jgi:splicing factor 3A subunit 2